MEAAQITSTRPGHDEPAAPMVRFVVIVGEAADGGSASRIEACPVRAQCLDYVLRNSIKCGIWGGLNPEERIRERRRRAHEHRAA